MNVNNVASEKPVSEVESKLRKLDEIALEIDKIVSNLNNRLSIILSNYPQTNPDGAEVKASAGCALSEKIENVIDILDNQKSKLISIIDKLMI